MYASLASPIDFLTLLKKRLASPLPGAAAQDKMSSRARLPLETYLQKHPDYRTSAVLMLMYPLNEMVHTMIIERPSYEGIHSGQLALPGGKMDQGDLSPMDTAIRETFEEVGVRVTRAQLIGELTPLYIPPSNFLVHPFVAWLDEQPVFVPDEREVEAILEVPLNTFLNPELKSRRRIVIGTNMFIEAPCYMLGDQVLWGATAMMFSELEAIIEGE
ncbi:MAG TPA: CoA pyrophosphatase [Bacteroidia bacterium]|nr:CoA pyrophosphatase [Bacteroidia bacterium]